MKTSDFLVEIIRRHNLTTRTGELGTAYSLWKHMNEKYGWTKASVSNYFSGKGFPDKPQCMHIAQELELDPGFVMVCIEADRTREPEIKAALEDAAERLKDTSKNNTTRRGGGMRRQVGALFLASVIGLGTAIPEAAQGVTESPANNKYRTYNRQIQLLRLLAVLRRRERQLRNIAATSLPERTRIITHHGGTLVRLFPENPMPARQHRADIGQFLPLGNEAKPATAELVHLAFTKNKKEAHPHEMPTSHHPRKLPAGQRGYNRGVDR